MGGAPLWFVQGCRGKAFVDPQHDVGLPSAGYCRIAAREGFYSAELLKRYTTLGMGTDQGKTSALNGHALIGALTGRTPGRPRNHCLAAALHTGCNRRARSPGCTAAPNFRPSAGSRRATAAGGEPPVQPSWISASGGGRRHFTFAR